MGITSARPALLATLGRHQVGAMLATLVDFGTMGALVTGFGVPAALATAIGAAAGGISNFGIGRHWVFGATGTRAAVQAWRYGLVALVSLLLNAAGEYAFHDRLRVHYLVARVVVSLGVSVCWNFPAQRGFVYS